MSKSSFGDRTHNVVWFSASNREISLILRIIRYLGLVSGKRFDDAKELIKRCQSCWHLWSWRPSFTYKNNLILFRSFRFATATAFYNINAVVSREFIWCSCRSHPMHGLQLGSLLSFFHLEGGHLRYPFLYVVGSHSRWRWKENTILLEEWLLILTVYDMTRSFRTPKTFTWYTDAWESTL
jgi:hypothetical protein